MRYAFPIVIVVLCACYLLAPEQTEWHFNLDTAALRAEGQAIMREHDKNAADAGGMPYLPETFAPPEIG
jgi:hypothetical protein